MPMPSVDGLPARRAALQILDSVIRRGTTLDAAAANVSGLPPSDHALAVAIAGETMRRLPDLDALIDSATRNRLPDDAKARMVIRLALAQAIGLNTPAHAVVSTALPLVDGGPRRLVHGVLGTLLRRGIASASSPHLPQEVEDRWRSSWGEAVVDYARSAIAQRPPLDLSFKSESAATNFAAQNDGRVLAPRHVRLASRKVVDLPGFGDGAFWVQDLAASLPARLVTPGARRVLDLCAAPGGKTMQLVAAGHDVTALDRDGRRLDRLRSNLERTTLAASIIEADALEWTPGSAYDAILIDAPCSATGTFRRHPEVLTRARLRIISSSTELQAAMLDRAAGWVKPGGTITYAVCSLEPEEGEGAIRAFLDRNPAFAVQPPMAGELPDFATTSSDGWVRILPGTLGAEGGLDGFFIARLVAKG
jgi:16S rRNA (cytosine967-C5)-methyltransferase